MKEGQGGRRDGEEGGRGLESEKNKIVVKEMKNEKVAKGRIIGLAGPCYHHHHHHHHHFLLFFLIK